MRHKEMKDENIGTQDPEQFLSIVINQTEISKQDMSVQHKQPKKGPFSVFKCPNTKVEAYHQPNFFNGLSGHIAWSTFTHNSNGKHHSTHSSFPEVLVSNGTSEETRVTRLVSMNSNKN